MEKGVAMKYEYRQISNVMNKYPFEISRKLTGFNRADRE